MKTVAAAPGSLLDTLELLVPGASRRTLRQMLVQDRIRINGEICRRAAHPVRAGDALEIKTRNRRAELPTGVDVLHEDESLLVVQKPSGLLTVATPDEREETLYAYLRRFLRESHPRQNLYIVHRLDKYASGVLVFAKTADVQDRLKELFSRHDVRRNYWAIVDGRVQRDRGTVRSCLAEDRSFRVHSVVEDRKLGKQAVTHYRVLQRFQEFTALEVTLETGRKHQIRVHLSEIGHPVAGDRTYGAKKDPLGRLALHAFHLGFKHPTRGEPVEFTTEPPPEFLPYLPKQK
ncbi:MAG: RluA family pseudouridine synthase [Acidobacteria bacterium]|nr:RluA family pseudouridine synthase [Acidobacteriota bacterium]